MVIDAMAMMMHQDEDSAWHAIGDEVERWSEDDLINCVESAICLTGASHSGSIRAMVVTHLSAEVADSEDAAVSMARKIVSTWQEGDFDRYLENLC